MQASKPLQQNWMRSSPQSLALDLSLSATYRLSPLDSGPSTFHCLPPVPILPSRWPAPRVGGTTCQILLQGSDFVSKAVTAQISLGKGMGFVSELCQRCLPRHVDTT